MFLWRSLKPSAVEHLLRVIANAAAPKPAPVEKPKKKIS